MLGFLGSYVLEMQTRTVYALVLLAELRLSERKCTTVTEQKDETTDIDGTRTTVMLDVMVVIRTIKKHIKENTLCIW
jgi:hypothetical protein